MNDITDYFFFQVRFADTPCVDCAILVHLQGALYRVVRPGSLNCVSEGSVQVLNLTSKLFSSQDYTSCFNQQIQFGNRGLRLRVLSVNSSENSVESLIVRSMYNISSTLNLTHSREMHDKISAGFRHGIVQAQEELSDIRDMAIRESAGQLERDTYLTASVSVVGFIVFVLVALIFCRVVRGRRGVHSPPSSVEIL